MPKIVVCHSRKGGVGKTTIAYELAWLLHAPLVDLEFDGGSATRKWGYRYEDRTVSPIMAALEHGRTPRPLRGFNKPDLVPGHPDLYEAQPTAEDMADALLKWAGEWGREWVVIDTHPGASPAAHGAVSIANVIIAPTPLRTSDLDGTEQMVKEMSDYPIVLVPTFIPPTPPAAGIQRLRDMVEGTPIQVGVPIPAALAVGTRKKRMAITSEDPPARALRPVADAMRSLAAFVKAYAND
jgi:chromosome partitioning protein